MPMTTKSKPKEPITFAPFSILVQVIHQPESRFIVLSYPDDPSLDLLSDNLPPLLKSRNAKSSHSNKEEKKYGTKRSSRTSNEEENKQLVFEVGEVDGSKRWWFGTWTMEDIKKTAGSGAPEEAYNTIIQRTAEQFQEGYLSIGGLPPKDGAEDFSTQASSQYSQSQPQSLLEGTSQGDSKAKVPYLRIDSAMDASALKIYLSPLTPEMAHKRSIDVLFAVFSRVSSEKAGRLFKPTGVESSQIVPLNPQSSLSPSRLSTAQRYEALKARQREEELVKQVEYFSSELKKHDNKVPAPRPPPVIPGRSLGNPAKKARRIETVEFEDDSEDEKATRKAQKKRRKA